MALIIVENLRGFFNSRPPLVVFMICLASFAIALITFAYIVKTKDMPNPDLTEDWNNLLENFADLQFCLSQGVTNHNITSGNTLKIAEQSPGDIVQGIKDNLLKRKHPVPEERQLKRYVRELDASPTHQVPVVSNLVEPPSTEAESSTLSTSTSSVHKDGISPVITGAGTSSPQCSAGRRYVVKACVTRNVTMDINFEVKPNQELLSLPFSAVHFTAEITGNMLHMKGSRKDKKMLVTLSFPQNLSHSECEEMSKGVCLSYVVKACITLTGPSSMLPRIYPRRFAESDTCPNFADLSSDVVMRNVTAATSAVSSRSSWCAQGAQMKAAYTFDDSLTIFLSQEERSVINLHLMRTSYFLFVMVVTLFCYAMVKSRPGKVKAVQHIPYEKAN